MQTLTTGSFLNLENASTVEALKFTAHRLAEHTANVVAENLRGPALENLANNLWQKAEYVTLDVERRRLQQIFVENFTERFRELKPEVPEKETQSLDVSTADSVKPLPAPETIERGESECTTSEGLSSDSSQELQTVAEGKRDEFLGFVKSGEPVTDASIAKTDMAPAITNAPEETEQAAVQAAGETASETLKPENEGITTETANSEKSCDVAEDKISAENPSDTKLQPASSQTVAKSNSPATKVDKNSKPAQAATDAKEPFEFGKCTVNLNLVLLPREGDGEGRKAIASASSHRFPPEIDFLEIVEAEDLTEIADLVRDKLARFKLTLPAKYIEQLRTTKAKSAKKPATAKATTVAVTPQPAINQISAEKTSGGQKEQDLGGVKAENIEREVVTVKETSMVAATTAPVSTVSQPIAAANNVQPSLF